MLENAFLLFQPAGKIFVGLSRPEASMNLRPLKRMRRADSLLLSFPLINLVHLIKSER
jgi:hypothetical protein